MKLVFGPDFPAAPPKGYFITPIFHPNVSKSGEICVNTLKKDWRAECKLSHILMVTSDALNFMLIKCVDYRIMSTGQNNQIYIHCPRCIMRLFST
jgi:hypothetical protein